jgi:hypothetical protein
MRKILPLLITALLAVSCATTPTRSERIEDAARKCLLNQPEPISAYTIVAKDTESDEDTMLAFVGYRCTIADEYSVYKVIFIGVQGDNIVYVGTDKEWAFDKTFRKP